MIAVLAPSLERAHRELTSVSWRDRDRGEATFPTGRHPFRIFTREEDLRGVLLSGFFIVGHVPTVLVDMARTRIR